jgi:hypothetical protein
MRHIGSLLCGCTVALAAAAHAQSTTPAPASAADPAEQAILAAQAAQAAQSAQAAQPGAAATAAESPRGIFLATLSALMAQHIGGAVAEGIGGSITRWFQHARQPATASPGQPSAAAQMQSAQTQSAQQQAALQQAALQQAALQQAAQTQAAPTQATQATGEPGPARDSAAATGQGALHAGVAYEVQAIAPDGSVRTVDAASHAFHTGDQFQVQYRPLLPGRVDVFNIDPRGSKSRVDEATVAAGQLATLGPYRFVDAKGLETLKLVLAPCSSATLAARTRGIVKSDAAGTADAALRIADCADPRTRSLQAKARAIVRTTVEGSTSYALDPLSRGEAASGFVGARELSISLLHR